MGRPDSAAPRLKLKNPQLKLGVLLEFSQFGHEAGMKSSMVLIVCPVPKSRRSGDL